MRKKFCSIAVLMLLLVVSLCGCMRYEATFDTTKYGKYYTMRMTTWFDKEKIDSLGEDGATSANNNGEDMSMDDIKKLPVVKINGKEYYKQTSKEEKTPFFNKKPEGSGLIVTKTSFYASSGMDSVNNNDTSSSSGNAEDIDMSEFIEKVTVKVLFKDKIKTTNGKIGKNKKSVEFTYDNNKKNAKANDEVYAYTVKATHTLKGDRAIIKKYAKKNSKKK